MCKTDKDILDAVIAPKVMALGLNTFAINTVFF